MPARERKKLTDAAIARLRPRAREYTVWDRNLAGFGVRVRPTGGKSYVLLEETGGRTKRVSLGPVSTRNIQEARRACHERRARPEPVETPEPAPPVPLFREFVEGAWKKAHFDRYKLSSRKKVQLLLARRLLPAFGNQPLDRIASAKVRRWFDIWSGTAPGGANKGLQLFRQIMNFAIACGHVEKNPAESIRPNRRPKLTRFLSREEIARLHRVLDMQTGEGNHWQADIIRLLLLTGCRKGEIVALRWAAIQANGLVLADSKTGPRRVPLNAHARRILERQMRGESPFVFPSPRDPSRTRDGELTLWYRVRREAGIEDVRLHDLRHTFASQAVMSGIPVPVVSRMLGHSSVRMTLRYAHLGDREIEEAAEKVGQAIAAIMEFEPALPTGDRSRPNSSKFCPETS